MDTDIKQKIDFVDQYIDRFAKRLSNNDKYVEDSLKVEVGKIILQDDLKSSNEELSSLIQVLSKEQSGVNTKTIVEAKEAGLELNLWIKNNIDLVRLYRGEVLRASFVKETIKINPKITKDGIKATEDYIDEVVKISNNPGIENQIDPILKEFEGESPGKREIAFNDTDNMVKMMGQSTEQLEKTISNNEKITERLQQHEVKIPLNKKVNSYDRVINSIKNPEVRRFIESARSRFKTLERISNGKFSQVANNFVSKIRGDRLRSVANNFFNKSIVKVSNGFASKIGNQAVRNFVQNSMGTIMKNGISSGMKSIAKGVMKKGAQVAGKAALNVASKLGLKAAALGLKAAFGAATAGVGLIITAGLEALKLGGKIIGKLISSLGLELTNNKLADTTIFIFIALLVLLGGMGTATASDVSSLKPNMDEDDLVPPSHGEIIYTEDGRIKSCGVGMGTDFYRYKHTIMVSPEAISRALRTIEDYNEQLREYIGNEYGNRCGVVYAAHYLAYNFDFWVPYSFGGVYNIGIHPNWGTPHDDGRGHTREGVDCASFREWMFLNGRGGSVGFEEIPINSQNCEYIKSIIEPGDGLSIRTPGYHFGVVLEYNDTHIKFAHSGGGLSGVTTGLVNICTGRQEIDGKGNNFQFLQKRKY